MNFSDPKTNVLQLGLREGMSVADLGAGAGHYGVAAAAAVGRDGKVFLVDIQEDILTHAVATAHERKCFNVERIRGNIETPGGTKLRDATIDAAILSNVLFQLEDRKTAVQEVLRILKPGGKLLLIDWAGSYGGLGPQPEHVITEHAAEELCITGGFHKVKDFRAGAHHYAIVFTKPAYA